MDMGHDEEHEQRGLSAGLGSVAGVACLINHCFHFRCRVASNLVADLTESIFGIHILKGSPRNTSGFSDWRKLGRDSDFHLIIGASWLPLL